VKVLVLGGTLFLGRHLVEAALERGHEVTLFNRGQTNPGLFQDAEHLRGDRDGDLSALVGREWDAVADPSGYVPRVVRATTELLAGATGHYSFVSSVSVYQDYRDSGIDEDYPLAELTEESEDVATHYGALKALSEDVVREGFEERTLIVRAGVIVGPYDWSNRFGWWVRRVARGGEVVVPATPEWPVQIVHARDLADWMLDMAERRAGGTFNAVSEPMPMMDVLAEIRDITGGDAAFVPVDEQFLLDKGVEPWDGLPLWLATFAHPDFVGMMTVDVSRAEAAGLRCRPLAETIREVLGWEEPPVSKDYGSRGGSSGLDPEREREILAAWATLKKQRERLSGR
jgi:nucleoside-diphosphate-sugar epimerase